MELVRGIHNLCFQHHGCALTIGNFDGVHLGHQRVLHQLSRKARELGLSSAVMVFEPQPQELFTKTRAPARITSLRDKYFQLHRLDIDFLLCINFNRNFANLSAESFVHDLLVSRLGVRFLVVGDDFRFGKGRKGNFDMLTRAGKQRGFDVVSTESFQVDSTRISSTSIREALARCDLRSAAMMLGRHYSISGRVSHGRKLARTIGFPTANILLKHFFLPTSGVYVVNVSGLSHSLVNGVANIGQRPTVGGVNQKLEVHLFGVSGNLYGKRLNVILLHKLREEEKFESVGILRKQIELDSEAARNWLLQHIS